METQRSSLSCVNLPPAVRFRLEGRGFHTAQVRQLKVKMLYLGCCFSPSQSTALSYLLYLWQDVLQKSDMELMESLDVDLLTVRSVVAAVSLASCPPHCTVGRTSLHALFLSWYFSEMVGATPQMLEFAQVHRLKMIRSHELGSLNSRFSPVLHTHSPFLRTPDLPLTRPLAE